MENKIIASPSSQSLAQWFTSPLGQAVFAAECEQLSLVLPSLFGLHLLQLDCEEQSAWLNKSPIHHRVIINQENPLEKKISIIRGLFNQLPFRNDSIDVVLLPHTLEASL